MTASYSEGARTLIVSHASARALIKIGGRGSPRCRCRAAGLWHHAPRPRRRGHAGGPAWSVFSAVRPSRRRTITPMSAGAYPQGSRCNCSGTAGFVHQSGVVKLLEFSRARHWSSVERLSTRGTAAAGYAHMVDGEERAG